MRSSNLMSILLTCNILIIICTSFIQQSFQIAEFISSKLELLHDKKNRFICRLYFILCIAVPPLMWCEQALLRQVFSHPNSLYSSRYIATLNELVDQSRLKALRRNKLNLTSDCYISISLMHSYEYDICHLAEEIFENSPGKQNNDKPVISTALSLFQPLSNVKHSYQAKQYNRAFVLLSPHQLFPIMLVSCRPVNNIAVLGRIWRKQSLPGKAFRCLSPLHKESRYFKIHFSESIKCFNKYVQYPLHKLLNCLWIFLKGMNSEYLKKFDNLSTI